MDAVCLHWHLKHVFINQDSLFGSPNNNRAHNIPCNDKESMDFVGHSD